ncbi:Dihydrouridine synthase family [Lasiodiplodia theobromae]|uniref:tRNA-dihydrouridine(16/17) synthase [NAD(P)(+)] n=1 Tax=Lasiodiplodia theobromae TaxID=45133 RepID=A0A5N5DLL2_9PEZI|nr:Dihydrouridine synthase family [Lasiodiplodia theobromae]KAB2578818.1 tRNA-dihydrouridine(16/17) synthase (NAD(P)(+)) [Lasiodiplodia theobromae]KAF4535403.1 Dihydrouridine synthase family [Lasiodiplodia theobromae]
MTATQPSVMENGQEKKPLCFQRPKLHGRAFYEALGSPKMVLAPMVEASEFAWRMLSRSFMPADQKNDLLAYTPMFHSRLFHEKPPYRKQSFQPLRDTIPSPPDPEQLKQYTTSDAHLDGNPAIDRPLFVQFCSNDPEDFIAAAQHVAPFCDAVDLNLGCPQGIARKGRYGAFLQEDWDTIRALISRLHAELPIPVTAKFRVQETHERTLEYARMLLDAGASIITVHGRQRHQKGHETGLADWDAIRYLRDNLPPNTVIFANGNILQHEDIEACLKATGADGVMSAEGNLYDPTIFAGPPPVGQEGREYWRSKDGKGGYRMDAVFRRYMDIIYKHVQGVAPPERKPLFLPSDPPAQEADKGEENEAAEEEEEGQPPKKKQRLANSNKKDAKKFERSTDPNLTAMQSHLFRLLRPLVAKHTNIRDALARCRSGNVEAFENVLQMVEAAVKEGLIEYEKEAGAPETNGAAEPTVETKELDPHESSLAAVNRCKRPWFICQPYVRPLPKEALEKGALSLSKKDKKKMEEQKQKEDEEAKKAGVAPEGRVEEVEVEKKVKDGDVRVEKTEIPKEGVVCG